MCCVAEIGMLIFGIIALVTGKFSLTRSRVVQGTAARIVGAVLVLPLPLGLLVGVVMGVGLGINAAKQGKQGLDQAELAKLQPKITIIEGSLIAVCFFTALGIALATAKPPKKKRRRRDEDEEYDDEDRPRRRAVREEEDEDDAPPARRRRGREDEDDEPDQPDDRIQGRPRR
jgi:hypothetical protein